MPSQTIMLDKRDRQCYPLSLVAMEQLGWAGQREPGSKKQEARRREEQRVEGRRQKTDQQSRNLTSNQRYPTWRGYDHRKHGDRYPKGRAWYNQRQVNNARGQKPARSCVRTVARARSSHRFGEALRGSRRSFATRTPSSGNLPISKWVPFFILLAVLYDKKCHFTK